MSEQVKPWKTALVTGASSGLGRGLAGWLVKRGVKVYAAARRLELLQSLEAESNGLVVPMKLDVGDADATFAAVSELDVKSGGLDLVIANAGGGSETHLEKLEWAPIKQMIDVNVAGATATLCGALPGMMQRGRGHLVGMSSLAGLMPLPRASTYCATKAFLGMFLNSLRLDAEPAGVAVTSIHPGFVSTAPNAGKKLPFMITPEEATERMGKALLRKAKVFTFPWQLSAAIALGSSLPRPVQGALLRKIR